MRPKSPMVNFICQQLNLLLKPFPLRHSCRLYAGAWTLEIRPHSQDSYSLKVHLHEIFDIRFFSSKASSWSPDQDPKLFSNTNSKSPRYSNSKVIPRIIRIRGNKLFCRARAKKLIIPFRSSVQLHTYILFFEVVVL